MTETQAPPRSDRIDQLTRMWVEDGRQDVRTELFERVKAEWAPRVRRSLGGRSDEEFEDRMQGLLLHAMDHAEGRRHPRLYTPVIQRSARSFRKALCRNYLASLARSEIRDLQRADAWARDMSQDADMERVAADTGDTRTADSLTERKGVPARPMDHLLPDAVELRLESLDLYAQAARLLPELVVRRRVAVGLCIALDCLRWAGELAEAQHNPPKTTDSEPDATARITVAQDAHAHLAVRCETAIVESRAARAPTAEDNHAGQMAVEALEAQVEDLRILVLFPSADTASNASNWKRMRRHGLRDLKERVRQSRSAASLGPLV